MSTQARRVMRHVPAAERSRCARGPGAGQTARGRGGLVSRPAPRGRRRGRPPGRSLTRLPAVSARPPGRLSPTAPRCAAGEALGAGRPSTGSCPRPWPRLFCARTPETRAVELPLPARRVASGLSLQPTGPGSWGRGTGTRRPEGGGTEPGAGPRAGRRGGGSCGAGRWEVKQLLGIFAALKWTLLPERTGAGEVSDLQV